jgi:hypothetical protein
MPYTTGCSWGFIHSLAPPSSTRYR